MDMQKPLCAFHTLTVVSDDAEITTGKKKEKKKKYIYVTHVRGLHQLVNQSKSVDKSVDK